jgi:hypothetical protein
MIPAQAQLRPQAHFLYLGQRYDATSYDDTDVASPGARAVVLMFADLRRLLVGQAGNSPDGF